MKGRYGYRRGFWLFSDAANECYFIPKDRPIIANGVPGTIPFSFGKNEMIAKIHFTPGMTLDAYTMETFQ